MQTFFKRVFGTTKASDILFDVFTFEKKLAQPLIHLIYWAGICLLVIMAFGVVGASVGIIMNEGLRGIFAATPVLVGGFLIIASGLLLWRAFCEFYVAVLKIGDDLKALRQAAESDAAYQQSPAAQNQAFPAHTYQNTAPVYAQSVTQSINPAPAQPAAVAADPILPFTPDFHDPLTSDLRAPAAAHASDSHKESDPLSDPFYRRIRGVVED